MITIDPTEPEAPKVALWPADYIGPKLAPDHCGDVLAGSYDVPYYPKSPPTILDIGANIGAFARWAVRRWPGCTIHCYEPQAGNFKLLTRTWKGMLRADPNILLHEMAVTNGSSPVHLVPGELNCGEAHLVETGGEIVEATPAGLLPVADILKMDTEGCEPLILDGLYRAGRLQEFAAIMLEYHNDAHGAMMMELLLAHGFWITGFRPWAPNRGELKFINSKKRLDFILPPLSPV